ncbi:MAG: cyclic lactone autoinducer peptide [Bacilli bacterium]|jgi:cyclic lactone autoinducer peptide|uniref:AgrD family cyclic lactone autoinducer peptide n=1 Tax=Ureibacillus suwonensis TaxID=313007 RepID=A0ABW0RIV0_9BACL
MKWMSVKNVLAKIAAFVVVFGGIATTNGCTTLFHEKKVPNELLQNNLFASKK